MELELLAAALGGFCPFACLDSLNAAARLRLASLRAAAAALLADWFLQTPWSVGCEAPMRGPVNEDPQL